MAVFICVKRYNVLLNDQNQFPQLHNVSQLDLVWDKYIEEAQPGQNVAKVYEGE